MDFPKASYVTISDSRTKAPAKASADSATHAAEDLLRLNLIGASPVFTETLHLIQRVARSEAAVLIQGETGTGKELAARAIHYLGQRRDFPFIPINCGALPDQLVENELFGHARGAFTDARESTTGLISEAEGGTLFLDEVETLSLKAQATMLRFLQDGTFRPLGGRQLRQANVRIIAASNIDLAELVRAGTFRLDLLYRLRLMAVEMPPLRERAGDVTLLAEAFLQRLILQYGEEKCLDRESLEALERHHWPGNVRELEHVLHREFLLTEGSILRVRQDSVDPFGPRIRRSKSDSPNAEATLDFNTAKARAISDFERAYIIRMLQKHAGNVSAAARSCGKERRTFGRLMKKYGIDKERYR